MTGAIIPLITNHHFISFNEGCLLENLTHLSFTRPNTDVTTSAVQTLQKSIKNDSINWL